MNFDNFLEWFITFKEYYTELLQNDNFNCNFVESCIRTYYKKNYGILYHVSGILDLKIIRPNSNYDMYSNKFCEKVFATSNPYEIWLYACRVISGEMHEKNRICIYPNNPFIFYKNGYYYLKRNVAVYMIKSEDFLPVINVGFKDDKDKFYFDNEWTSNKEITPLNKFEINCIPEEFTKYYTVYYFIDKDFTKYPKSLDELFYLEKNKKIKKI